MTCLLYTSCLPIASTAARNVALLYAVPLKLENVLLISMTACVFCFCRNRFVKIPMLLYSFQKLFYLCGGKESPCTVSPVAACLLYTSTSHHWADCCRTINQQHNEVVIHTRICTARKQDVYKRQHQRCSDADHGGAILLYFPDFGSRFGRETLDLFGINNKRCV